MARVLAVRPHAWAGGLFALGLLLLPVFPAPVAADDLPQGASAKAAETLRVLSTEAEKVRTTGVLDATRINGFFAADGHSPFQVDLPRAPDRQISNDLWSYFFRGSQVYPARLSAERPLVAYYNVIVDAWLVTRWSRHDGTFRMTDAQVLLGDVLQGATAGNIQASPRWLSEIPDLSAVAAIQAQAAGAVPAFHAAHPLDAARDGTLDDGVGQVFARAILSQRLAGFLGLLADVTADGPIAQLEEQFARAIKAGDADALEGLVAAALESETIELMTGATQMVREGLSPLLAVESGGVTVIFSAAPTQARFFYYTAYYEQDGRRPVLQDVGAIDAYAQVR
jgi:hypothetical protein